MKISLLHYATTPVIGGVERILDAHARLFRKAGHEVTLISMRGDADARLHPAKSADEYVAQLRPLLAEADLVIVHNVMTMPFDLALTEALTRMPSYLPRARFAAWVHDIAAANPDLAPVPPLLRHAWPGFEYVAVSEMRAKEFAQVIGHRCLVIPNGIDIFNVLGLSENLTRFAERVLDGGMILLHPTRLLRRKNVELGIQMMDSLRDATLLITGAEDTHNPASVEYAAALRALRSRLGLEKQVIFVSDDFPVSDADLSGLYQIADALFLPSRQEGFGLPVLEAEAHRLLAFISDIAAFDEITGPSSRRFPLNMPPAQLARWIREELAADAGFRARRHAVRWRWDRVWTECLQPWITRV